MSQLLSNKPPFPLFSPVKSRRPINHIPNNPIGRKRQQRYGPLMAKKSKAASPAKVVFLFDVDNTLLDSDRVTEDLRRHLEREVGADGARRYWVIFEQLRTELGYADYLGALQRFRTEFPHDLRVLTVSRFLINYPFAN